MKKLNYVLLLLLLNGELFAQDTLRISYQKSFTQQTQAEKLVSRFMDLLNYISFSQNEPYEADTAIYYSFTISDNRQLFADKDVNVESDLLPLDYSKAKGQDVNIERYLNDFNFQYTKSENDNVVFKNIKATGLKNNAYPYFNVYFESIFKGRFIPDSAKEYFSVFRKAEVRVFQRDSIWYSRITAISMATGSAETDTTNNFTNFIASSTDESLLTELMLKRQQQEKEEQEDRKYNAMITEAENYYSKEDFENALYNYKKAKAFISYRKPAIDGIKKCEEQIKLKKEKAAADAKKDQENNEKKRQAEFLFLQRKFVEAKPLLDELAFIYPTDESIKTNLREVNYLNPKVETISSNYKLKKYDDAIKQCDLFNGDENGNKKSSRPEFHFWKAKCLWQKDSTNKTTKFFENLELAIQAAGNNYPEAQLERIRIYLKQGPAKLADVILDYSNLITYYPRNADYLVSRAKATENSLPDDALNDYNKAVILKPGDAKIFFSKGLLEYYLSKYTQSLSSLDSVLAVEKNNANAFYYKGLNYDKLNEYINAGKCFYAAKVNHLDTARVSDIRRIAKSYCDAGMAGNNSANYLAAIPQFSNSILTDTSANALYGRGLAFYKTGKFNDAINDFEIVNRLQVTYIDAWYYKGVCREMLNNVEAALADYNKELMYHDNNLKAQIAAGNANIKLEHYNDGAKNYLKAFELSKEDSLLLHIGKNFYLAKDYPMANNYLTKSIKSKPNAHNYFYRGMSYFMSNDFKNAVSDLKAALDKQPGYPTANRFLGKSYFNLKDYENAEAAFLSAKNDESNTAENYYYYAQCCFYLKIKPDNIYSDLYNAKRMDTIIYNTAFTYSLIAYGRMNSGSDSSVYGNELNKAEMLNSDDGTLHFVKACMYARLKNSDEMYKQLEVILAKKVFERDFIYREPSFAEIKKTKEFDKFLDKHFKK